MKRALFTLIAVLAARCAGIAQQNLIPNHDFSDPVPLKGWRVDFPYQDWYVKNAGYVKHVTMAGKRCAIIDLPPGVAGNEGGKIETALVPAIPGATYRAEVECYLPELSAKIHAEAFAVNPDPRTQITEQGQPVKPGGADKPANPDMPKRDAKGPVTTIFRIPATGTMPALLAIYRAQFPDPAGGAKWVKVEREFTLPWEWEVNLGKDERNKNKHVKVKPAYLSIKAYTYGATMGAGKSYFTNFKLFKIKDPDPAGAPKGGTLR